MGQISPQKFTTEDFTDQQSWIGKLFSPLNSFIGEIVTNFTNGITVEDNLFQEIKEIKYVNTATNFPLKFTTKFKQHPRGVFPIYLLNNTLGSYSLLQPWVVWSYSDGQVIISDIDGLTASSTYTIRLLVIYG